MSESIIATIRFRRGTAALWTQRNPTPASGEPCYETDTGLVKIGNGIEDWNTLDYLAGAAITGLVERLDEVDIQILEIDGQLATVDDRITTAVAESLVGVETRLDETDGTVEEINGTLAGRLSEGALANKIETSIAETFVATVYVSPEEGIQAALDSVAQIATEPRYGSAMTSGTTAPVKADVRVPAGVWLISAPLRLPEGVTLILDDRAIVRATTAMSVMIDTDITKRYSGTGIYGGIWDCNNLAQRAVYVRWAGHFTIDIRQIRNTALHGIVFGDPAAATASFEGFIGPVFIVRPNNQSVPTGGIGIHLYNATDCVIGTRKGTIIVGQDIQVRVDGAAHTVDGVHPWGFGSTAANGFATGLTPSYSFYINAQATKLFDCYADGVKAGGAGYYFTANATGTKAFGCSAFLNDITDTPDNSADAFRFEAGARVALFGPVIRALATKRWKTDYAGNLTNVNVFGQTYENVVTVNKPITSPGYGVWQDATPTIYDNTGVAVPLGTTPVRYGRIRTDGQTVEFTARITLGTTPGAGSGSWFLGGLAGLSHKYTTTTAIGSGYMLDTSANLYKQVTVYAFAGDPGKFGLVFDPSGPVSGTAPWTWAAGDVLSVQGRYELLL